MGDSFSIVVKIKLLERRKYHSAHNLLLATTTITYCLEGRNDVQKVYVNKPASQITLAEVKNRFPGVGGVFLFKTSGSRMPVLCDSFFLRCREPSLDSYCG